MSDSVRPHRRQPTRLPRPWDSPGKNTGVGCHSLLQCMKVKSESEVAQSRPTLHDPTDCSPPGSSVHGIFQARVLEWGAIAFSNRRYSVLIYNVFYTYCLNRLYSVNSTFIYFGKWKKSTWLALLLYLLYKPTVSLRYASNYSWTLDFIGTK